MISLKSYCVPLSWELGMTPDALYERQRVLARGGYLTGAIAGKGPGSGIRATVPNVTKLLLSTLATDTLSEIDAKTRKFATLKQVDGKCPLTGELRFQNALEKILASPDLTKSVLGIELRREQMGATISYVIMPRKFRRDSDFGQPRRHPPDPPLLQGRLITARLEGWSIGMIADDLQDIASGAPIRNYAPFKDEAHQ
jgi:hypothetical protein